MTIKGVIHVGELHAYPRLIVKFSSSFPYPHPFPLVSPYLKLKRVYYIATRQLTCVESYIGDFEEQKQGRTSENCYGFKQGQRA